MIRTSIVLDEKLVKAAMKATKLKTRNALIDYALREVMRHAHQKELLKLRGKFEWEGSLNQSRQDDNRRN